MKGTYFAIYCVILGFILLLSVSYMISSFSATSYYVVETHTTPFALPSVTTQVVSQVPEKPQEIQHYEQMRDDIVKQQEGIPDNVSQVDQNYNLTANILEVYYQTFGKISGWVTVTMIVVFTWVFFKGFWRRSRWL